MLNSKPGGIKKPSLSGANQYDFRGTAGKDTLIGNNSDNRLQGFRSDDKLDGLGGKDELLGGKGDDTLKGGAANDTLDGGDGNDLLYGGSGKDTYVFREFGKSIGDDIIDDGADGQVDIIDLRAFSSENLKYAMPVDSDGDEMWDSLRLNLGGELGASSIPEHNLGTILIRDFFAENSGSFEDLAPGSNQVIVLVGDERLGYDELVDLILA